MRQVAGGGGITVWRGAQGERQVEIGSRMTVWRCAACGGGLLCDGMDDAG